MATKKELYDHLARLTEENHILKHENEAFRSVLNNFYVKIRDVLGIEAAIQEREDLKQKEKEIALNEI